jgi:kynureninase
VGHGVGSALTIKDSSFENQYSLADGWRLERGRILGAATPIQEVMIDTRTAVDGTSSVRFYATERTRVFQNVVQEIVVQPGALSRFRVQHKTENVRVEFQQNRSDFKVQITYLNNGSPVAPPIKAHGRMGSHSWELLELEHKTPHNATEARIELICSLSGTAWFDGLIFEVIESNQQW